LTLALLDFKIEILMVNCASPSFVLLFLLYALISTSCGDGQPFAFAADGGDVADGSTLIDGYDSDSDISTDSQTDGPPSGVGLCDDYPEPQGGFAVGDVVASYALRDRLGQVNWLCEWGGGEGALLLLVLSSKW
jgi:hypothetical protein